jgi:C4-type Zn-finger protein
MKMAEHNPSLDFSCPVCGAIPKERCASIKGNFLSASHNERSNAKQDRCHASGYRKNDRQMSQARKKSDSLQRTAP